MNAADLESPHGLFLTGTDTGVGKTLVSAALAYLLAQQGVRVGVAKPFESGVSDPADLGEDGCLLRWASDSREDADRITPYRLREPLAPALAARREGVEIDWPYVIETIRAGRQRCEFQIVEGAGGLLVPLAGTRLVADLARESGWPLIIVARAGLGTINHTLLTLESARSRGLTVAGWVINGLEVTASVAEQHAAQEIARLTDIPCWGVLPQVVGTPQEKVVGLARVMQEWPAIRAMCDKLSVQAKAVSFCDK